MGIIGAMENFWKSNKWGVEYKGGWRNGFDRKQKTQIAEVNISNKHIYLYAIRVFKLFLVFLYAVSISLCTAVN